MCGRLEAGYLNASSCFAPTYVARCFLILSFMLNHELCANLLKQKPVECGSVFCFFATCDCVVFCIHSFI